MKKLQYIVSLAAIMLAASASAELIASESFSTGNGNDYTNSVGFGVTTNRAKVIGTTGFTTNNLWVGATTALLPRNFPGLTHALMQGTAANGLLSVRPLGATVVSGVTNINTRNNTRELASTPYGSSFYMSGLVKANNFTSIDPGESAAMGLNSNSIAGVWDISAGLHLGLTRDIAGDYYLAAFAAGNTYTLGSKLTGTQPTNTQMIVLKLEVDTSGTNDTLTAWIAQHGSTNLTQVLGVTNTINTGTAANLKTFGVQTLGGLDLISSPGVSLDEFRFGTQLSDVRSIPALFVHSLFQDHMILQRDMKVPVWGRAAPGAAVTVQLDGVEVGSAMADQTGRWRADINSHANDGGQPHTLRILAPNERDVLFSDVLFGDVYITSGQSNMGRALAGPIIATQEEIAAANYPLIRYIKLQTNAVASQLDEPVLIYGWTPCSPATAPSLSAVGYFFARRIHLSTGVPVGLLFCAWGGQQIARFIAPEGMTSVPELSGMQQYLEQGGLTGFYDISD